MSHVKILAKEEYVALVKENIEKFTKEELCQDTWKRFSEKLDYVLVDMKNADSYKAFKEHVDPNRMMVCYFAHASFDFW